MSTTLSPAKLATITGPASLARLTEARPQQPVRHSDLLTTLRWAPAPRWEGTAGHKARYVAYVAGSMVAWVVIGLAAAAALGGLTGLAG